MSNLYEELSEAVISGDSKGVTRLTRQGLDQGASPAEMLNQGLLPGMEVVGQHFGDGLVFIPEVILSAKTMSAAMDILRPLLTQGSSNDRGKVLIGTVQGDLHTIGKNLVAMLLEGAGFEVIDLGIDVKPEGFVAAVAKHKPRVLGMSALLTTTMPSMGDTIRALEEAGIREQVKIIIGGAPISEEFARMVGADGYAPNAAVAVDRVKALAGVA
jgi:5-methyltetrahydrofolate--homocysteine methyltransferase